MSDDFTQFTMRMSNFVYTSLKARAERNKRSIAKEIEFIIEEALKADKLKEEKLENLIKSLFDEYEKLGNKKIDVEKIVYDKSNQSPFKLAAVDLIDFVKSL